VDLTILGCRQGMPADGQASSCYLVTDGPARLLLDCGPGAATALSAVTHVSTLDAVVVSHLHSDHCYDLLPLGKTLLNGRIRNAHRFPTLPDAGTAIWPPVPLHVPAGGRTALGALAAALPVPTSPVLDRAFDLAFDLNEYEPGDELTIGGCQVRLYPLRHSLPNCGIRVTGPAGSLAYSGDTYDVPGLIELARGVDLFLCEATLELTDDTVHGHLTAAQAGEAAAAAGAGELVLTHFITADPEWLEARRADAQRFFDGPVHLASPGRRFEVRPGNGAHPAALAGRRQQAVTQL
jgi:ribonuclease BN (tRNA processing enzyme)